MANTLMALLVSIGIDASELQQGIEKAQKQVSGFSSSMQNIGKDMMKTGGAMTLGLTTPIVAFGKSAVQSALDSELALADLEAVLKSTGGTAGVTLEELTGNASALQKVTKFSDEAIMSAQGMLLTFTNIGKDTFPAATSATLDMAEKFGMDASQAAITLGKALNDPIAGVGALRRIGVQLTDEQEAQIKSFMAVGDVAAAQQIILSELSTEIGGVAEAAGATSAGEMAQFANQFDDLKEILGGQLIPALLELAIAVTPLIQAFAESSPEIQKLVLGGLALLAVVGPIVTVVGGLVTAIGAIAPVVASVAAALSGFALPIIAIIAAIALLYVAWTNNWGGIQEKFAAFVAWIKPIWDAVWTGIKAYFELALAQIKTLWEAFSLLFKGDFEGFGRKLREAWDRLWNAIGEAISKAGPIIKTGISNIVKSIINWFQNINWMEVGKNMMIGLANAMLGALPYLFSSLSSIGSAISQTFSGFMGGSRPTTSRGPGRALGGSVFAGTPYTVGEHGMETFVPTTNGKIIPNNKTSADGQNITINITNPKREAVEDSIRKSLKSLSYMGVATT